MMKRMVILKSEPKPDDRKNIKNIDDHNERDTRERYGSDTR